MNDPISAVRAMRDMSFDAEALGPMLSERKEFATIVAGLVSAGVPMTAVDYKLIRWYRSFTELYTAIDARLVEAGGASYKTFLETYAAIPKARRVRVMNWFNRPQSTKRMSEWDRREDLRARTGPVACVPPEPVQRELRDIENVIAARWKKLIAHGHLNGQILVFEHGPAGFEYVPGRTAANMLYADLLPKRERRFVLSAELPPYYIRKKGEGPAQRETRRREADAARYFIQRIQEAAPNKPWRVKADAIKELTQKFGLTDNSINKIWREHATADMKLGRMKPVSQNPKP